MSRRIGRTWIANLLVWGWLVQISGCGTVFFPERKGQPAGRLDPKVVALDAVGLLLFFVPGVIAFAVDFNNGTIYLPQETHVDTSTPLGSQTPINGWSAIRTESTSPNADEIKTVVHQTTGRSIQLLPGRYRVGTLQSVNELEDINFDRVALSTACEASAVCFRGQSESFTTPSKIAENPRRTEK